MVAQAVQLHASSRPWSRPRWPKAGLSESEVEGLILKFLAARGDDTGWGSQTRSAFPMHWSSTSLNQLKDARLVATADRR